MEVTEGGITVVVPEQSGDRKEAAVFYNPTQELNRDLTVSVLRAFRERNADATRYVDAMAASGIRGVRAAADGWDATIADWDREAVSLAKENVERNDIDASVVHAEANALLSRSRFDIVDLDPFGTPMPFVDSAFRSANGLVCVTATDTAPLCGAHFASGVRKYDSVPQNTEYHAEVGVRTLLSALVRVAARHDVGATPIFSHATRHYVRVYLAVDDRATAADRVLDDLGFVHHCTHCLHREHEHDRVAHPLTACPNCGESLVTAGPLWLGRTTDPEFADRVAAHVTDDMGTAEDARALCGTLADELAVPTHFDHHKLCKRWSRPAEKLDDFLAGVEAAGFETSRTHYGGTTFKTDATVSDLRATVE